MGRPFTIAYGGRVWIGGGRRPVASAALLNCLDKKFLFPY